MNNKKNDLKFGLSKEQEILPLLEEHFGKLNKLPPNDEFDFINDKYVVEVKSRRISIDTYPSPTDWSSPMSYAHACRMKKFLGI